MDLMEEDSVVWNFEDTIVWIYRNQADLADYLTATREDLKRDFGTELPVSIVSFLKEVKKLAPPANGKDISFCDGYLCCFQHDCFCFRRKYQHCSFRR